MPYQSRIFATIITTGFLLSAQTSLAARCEASKSIEESFPAEQLDHLRLHVLAGYLEVTGVESNHIQIHAKVCTDDAKYLSRMKLDVDLKGETLTLTSIIPYHDNDWHSDYAYMDVTVRVPMTLKTHIRDSSGDIEVRDLRLGSLDDSSGDIKLNKIKGPLVLTDSSGDIRLTELTGDLTISDSSGKIDLRSIKGNIIMPHDSSGDIEIEGVTGSIEIQSDSSGDIDIEEVSADVTVLSDSSGDIILEDIQGSVKIASDSSGRIKVSQIGGDFEVGIKGSGQIKIHDVSGKISLPKHLQ